jgi:hypothetical protein
MQIRREETSEGLCHHDIEADGFILSMARGGLSCDAPECPRVQKGRDWELVGIDGVEASNEAVVNRVAPMTYSTLTSTSLERLQSLSR